jgi:hypothetical protein
MRGSNLHSMVNHAHERRFQRGYLPAVKAKNVEKHQCGFAPNGQRVV